MKKLMLCIAVMFALMLTACGNKNEHKHSPITDAAVAASCTKSGLTEGSHCSDCSEILVAQNVIPALGHEYEITVKNATCQEEGANIHTCVRCDDTFSTDITQKTAHRFGEGEICLACNTAAPTHNIEPNTDWYVDTQMAFTLSTKEELAGLATLVNSGTSFNGKTIYLGANIDLGYLEWTPIGNSTYPFTAAFDGKGYTISSLKISNNNSYVGLFGHAKAEISNFTIDNASIYVKGIQNYVAIACAYSTADIRNVIVDGYVDAKLASYVGGIAGYSAGQLIGLTSDTDVVGNAFSGGIAGYMKISSAHFKDLKNYGDISINGIGDAGGLIGKIESSGSLYMENCENFGNVSGTDYSGGLVGAYVTSGSFSLENCNNCGNISGKEYTGGVMGYLKRDTTGNTITIKSFKNNGEISGFGCVGGIFGYYWCVGTSNIIGLENNGKVSGNNQYVGGIKGYADYVGAVLTDFTNNGAVVGNVYSGGIIGRIEVCESDLDIINFQNHRDVTGLSYTGGLMGYFSSNGTPSITKCENSGNISGNEYVGGIAGYGSTRALILSELINSGNVNGTAAYIGGAIGYLHGNNYAVTVDKCQSSSDISGTSYVSGLFGYINGNSNSNITNSTVCCNMTAQYVVGGIAAEAVNITISECANTGSFINATGIMVSGSSYYAYIGGIVGSGYRVEKCTNDVIINYTNRGSYVGGIAGYLKHSATECTNNSEISGYDFVGGIAGWLSSPYLDISSALANNANISGHDMVGGIIGKCEYGNVYNLSDCENSGNINGNAYVGGIMGSLCRTKSYDFTISGLNNTGDITANGGYAGGLFGHVYGYGANSVIENSSSSADICGSYIVGGLIGQAYTAAIKNSTNTGSTVTATGFILDGGYNRVYLGGYVGCGGYLEGLVNDVDIFYDQIGEYVGGIVGHLPDNEANYSILNCTNNGDIISTGDCVGGICGYYYEYCSGATHEILNSLKNTGAIKGKTYVGGIFGIFTADYRATYVSTDFTNLGKISGEAKVGEIFGRHYAARVSTLTGCTVLGWVTENGEVIENRDVGSNTNLTISDRTLYTTEDNNESDG